MECEIRDTLKDANEAVEQSLSKPLHAIRTDAPFTMVTLWEEAVARYRMTVVLQSSEEQLLLDATQALSIQNIHNNVFRQWSFFRRTKTRKFQGVRDRVDRIIGALREKITTIDVLIGYPTQAAFPPSAVVWGSIRIFLIAANAREKAYDLIESCLESVRHIFDRLQLSVSASEISMPLRNVYLSILVDVLDVFAIATTYVKRGAFRNYLEAIVREDHRLLKVYEHLNSLVIAEIAATTTQIKDEVGRLTLSTESIRQQVQSLSDQISEVSCLRASSFGSYSRDERSSWKMKDWLNPIPGLEDYFFELREERVAGTCEWILSDSVYIRWIGDPFSRLLLVHGPPGSGKSVLTSRIITEFSSVDSAKNICIFSYCRHDDERRRDLTATVRTAIFDLAERIQSYRENLRAFHEKGEFSNDDMKSMKFVWRKLFINLLQESKETLSIKWIIDGLDESSPKQRSEFLHCLSDLRYAKVDLKVLIASRYNEDIDKKLKNIGSEIIEIDGPQVAADVRRVIQHKIRISERLSSPHIVETVTSLMEQRSQGLFLWVKLVFDALATVTTDDAIIQCLETMPMSLSRMYERALHTLVDNLSSSDLNLAKEIFKWVLNAKRRLSLAELRSGLAPQVGILTNVELEVKRCCGGLIIVDPTKRVRLLHMTVSEYAAQTPSFFIDVYLANAALAKCCLNSIPKFDRIPSESRSAELEERFPLLLYACMYWSLHAEDSNSNDDDLREGILSFFTSSQLLAWIYAMFISGNHSSLTQALDRDWTRWGKGIEQIVASWDNDLHLLVQEPFGMVEKYDGEKKDGRRHGHGICVYEIGDRYEGSWEEGRRHGIGTLDFKNGNRFEGTWKQDKQHGRGIWTFSDGVSYQGEWVEGVPKPDGLWTFADGTTRRHLPETILGDTLPDLSRAAWKGGVCTVPIHDAVGQFEEESPGAPSTWIYPNGARYTGGWKEGKEEGYGLWHCACGSVYRGYWKDGMEYGTGVWVFRNGNRYTGEWKEAWENGFGVLAFHDGHQYSGYWKNGRANGSGLMTFANGNSYEGVWQDGQLQGESVFKFGQEWNERVKKSE